MTDLSMLLHKPKALLAAIVMGLIGAGAITGFSFAFHLFNNPPVQILSTRMLSATVPADGDIQFAVIAEASPDRNCVGTITREFYKPITVGGVEQREKKRTAGPVPIVHEGENNYVINVPLPPNMEPGKWSFQGETTFDCGMFGGGIKRYRTPEMPLEITEKGK